MNWCKFPRVRVVRAQTASGLGMGFQAAGGVGAALPVAQNMALGSIVAGFGFQLGVGAAAGVTATFDP